MSPQVSTLPPRGVLRQNVATLETAGVIEEISFHPNYIGLLLRRPVRCAQCGAEHCYFVNRNGRTRCCDCDVRARYPATGGQ